MEAPAEQRRLVEQHLGFVHAQASVIAKGLPRSIDLDDLVAYGTTGLCEAAARYEAGRGVSFTTFAYYRVRGAIYDGLRQLGWLHRREYARLREAERVDAYLQSQADRHGDRPTTLEDDVASLADTLAGAATIFVTSLAAEDDVPADAPPPEEELADAELREAVRAALATLPERERQLIEASYFGGQDLKTAGEALGVSKSWACRMHAAAMIDCGWPWIPMRPRQRPRPGRVRARRAQPARDSADNLRWRSSMTGPIAPVGGAPLAPASTASARPPSVAFTQVLGERAGPASPASPTGAPVEPTARGRGPADPGPAAGPRRLLIDLVEGERRMDRVIAAALSGRDFTVQELIAIQATVFRYTQELEVVSRVVDKATAAVKTTLQTQV